MLKVFLVIPTIRDLFFLNEWKDEFKKCHLIIIEDNGRQTIKVESSNYLSVNTYCHRDIEKDFGKNEWIFSRKNSGIRSYGFWKAFQEGADVVVTIDDDCYPAENNFINKHLKNLNFKSHFSWINTYPNPKWLYSRGFPYFGRDETETVISHGLWSGSLDLDAKSEINLDKKLEEDIYPPLRQIIPQNYFYPMCSMNLAFKKEIIPLMFFPMMGEDQTGNKWKYNRFDDIWAGIFSKKIIDHLNLGVVSGSPFVEHRKASKLSENLIKEKEGMKTNEILWKLVNDVRLSKKNSKDCYIELAKKIKFPKEKYFEKLREAMIIWANLF